ncbi:hypothetical protein GGS21DRAFT_541816 [Xylaria nigripes]|nr:hypothetical protein GGS21DRAFT_541816 [Xylaria nigripes]
MTTSTARLLARTTSKFTAVSIHPSQLARRSFSQTHIQKEDEKPRQSYSSILSMLPASTFMQPRPAPPPSSDLAGDHAEVKRVFATQHMARAMNQHESILGDVAVRDESWGPAHEPFHFHIYAHKHNTHVTVTLPNRNPIISMSTGNIGFKKTKRGSYDAAYQLCAYVLDKLNQGGWHRKIDALEVVLRGFGAGREAATKVLLGNEGRLLRPFIKKVSDDTKLKFGGTRSPRPKRLG